MLIIGEVEWLIRAYQYNTTFTYRNFKANPSFNNFRPRKSEDNFVIIEFPDENKIIIDKEKELSKLFNRKKSTDPIIVRRGEQYREGENNYDPKEWEIEYEDTLPDPPEFKYYPLFKKLKNGVNVFNRINRSDLFESPFAKIDYGNQEIMVGRPKMSFDHLYQEVFLRSNGAI